MAGTASSLQTALGVRLATISGLRVADHLPEQVNPPMAVIQMQSVTYHRAMAGGLSEWEFTVSLVAGRMGDRVAQRYLDGWMSYAGSQSVRAAIEGDKTLGGNCSTLKVGDMVAVRPLSLGDASYLTCEFNVTVHA
jgi:hypothetical protein